MPIIQWNHNQAAKTNRQDSAMYGSSFTIPGCSCPGQIEITITTSRPRLRSNGLSHRGTVSRNHETCSGTTPVLAIQKHTACYPRCKYCAANNQQPFSPGHYHVHYRWNIFHNASVPLTVIANTHHRRKIGPSSRLSRPSTSAMRSSIVLTPT